MPSDKEVENLDYQKSSMSMHSPLGRGWRGADAARHGPAPNTKKHPTPNIQHPTPSHKRRLTKNW